MTRIFLGGSRKCSRLTTAVRTRLDGIRRKGLCVLVGDANGADKAIQTYFAKHHYENLVVYCSGGRCRNNVGGWPVHSVGSDAKPGTRAFYSAKDREMARDADYGFMIWDGYSKGTYDNIVEMASRGKTALVYMTRDRAFRTMRHMSDLESDPLHRTASEETSPQYRKDPTSANSRGEPEPAPRLF